MGRATWPLVSPYSKPGHSSWGIHHPSIVLLTLVLFSQERCRKIARAFTFLLSPDKLAF